MNILITGSSGFIGRNLVENLKNIRDGKNRTRPGIHINRIFEYKRSCSLKQLEEFCSEADFVFHLAGANRPQDPSGFERDNVSFSETLIEMLQQLENRCPVLVSSSLQASLCGRFGKSAYGLSKKAEEEQFFQHAEKTGAPVYIYRFPNVVGKWARPNYNSAVATFCYCIAHDLPYTVHDRNTVLELLFIDDLLNEMYDALEGHPHHCGYPAGDSSGVIWDGLTPEPGSDGAYCYVPVTHRASLGEITDQLEEFKTLNETGLISEIPPGSFESKLYSMYLSYLPLGKMAYPLKMNVDNRGIFTELIKTANNGQISINIARPGNVRGQHWHNSKWEIFMVVSGHGLIQERRIGTEEVIEFEVRGEEMRAVIMLPGYAHNIINLENDRDLVTVMWANESFDPNHPDTFYEPVVK